MRQESAQSPQTLFTDVMCSHIQRTADAARLAMRLADVGRGVLSPDVYSCMYLSIRPENMDDTCSDVRELLAPTSSHVVHGRCASPLNVDRALIGQLSPLGKLSPTMES